MATSEQSSPLPLMATQQAGSRAGKGHCPSAPRQIQWPRGLAGLPRGSAFGVSPPRRTASDCSQALTARRQRDLGKEYRLRQWASSCVIRTEGPVRCVAAAPVAAMRPDVFGGRPSSERGDHYSRGMATRVAAWLAAAIFFVVAAFQAALVFGAPWGEYTQGGGTSGALAASGRVLAAISCVLLIVMAGAILARAGEGPARVDRAVGFGCHCDGDHPPHLIAAATNRTASRLAAGVGVSAVVDPPPTESLEPELVQIEHGHCSQLR